MRNKDGLTEEEFLASYNPRDYERPSVTVDMLIFILGGNEENREESKVLPNKTLHLLMIKRGNHPDMNKWALPGGFVEMNENLEDAARRELKEETGLDDIYMEQLYTWGDVDRDPRTRVIGVSYVALLDGETLEVKAADDARDAKWFKVSYKEFDEQRICLEQKDIQKLFYKLNLKSDTEDLEAVIKVVKTMNNGKITKIERTIIEKDNIAFDHAKIIQYAIEKLRLL